MLLRAWQWLYLVRLSCMIFYSSMTSNSNDKPIRTSRGTIIFNMFLNFSKSWLRYNGLLRKSLFLPLITCNKHFPKIFLETVFEPAHLLGTCSIFNSVFWSFNWMGLLPTWGMYKLSVLLLLYFKVTYNIGRNLLILLSCIHLYTKVMVQ